MNARIFRFFLFFIFLLIVFLYPIFADRGIPGVEIRDPERYYHRLKALRLKRPNDPYYTYQIANFFKSLEMEDEAIEEYRRCLKLDPNHIDAKWYLSKLLFGKEYYEEAFRHARDIMDKRPNDPEVYYHAGEILIKMGEPEIAKEYFSRCDRLTFGIKGIVY